MQHTSETYCVVAEQDERGSFVYATFQMAYGARWCASNLRECYNPAKGLQAPVRNVRWVRLATPEYRPADYHMLPSELEEALGAPGVRDESWA